MSSHMPLVRAIARRYGGRGEELEDLVQVGAVGLIKASARFDPSREVAFASFAAPAVEGEIRRHLSDRTGGLRLPRQTQRMSTELNRARRELTAALGRSPNERELAAALDADVNEVERLIAADLARHPVSIGDTVVDASGDGESSSNSECRVLVAGGLSALDDRERRVVFLRFYADMTEQQIARIVGISQAHVSRLLEGALTKLREELTPQADEAESGDSTPAGVIAPEMIDAAAAPTASADSRSPSRRPAKSRATTGYSGRILVRMPSELHEQLALAAEKKEVSLNRHVTDVLSGSLASGRSRDRPRTRAVRLALATNLVLVIVAGVVAVALFVLAVQRGI